MSDFDKTVQTMPTCVRVCVSHPHVYTALSDLKPCSSICSWLAGGNKSIDYPFVELLSCVSVILEFHFGFTIELRFNV